MKRPSIIRRLLRFVLVTLPALLIVLAFLASASAWVLSYRVTARWDQALPNGTVIGLALVSDQGKSTVTASPPPMHIYLEASRGFAHLLYFDRRYYSNRTPGCGPAYWSRKFEWGVQSAWCAGIGGLGLAAATIELRLLTSVLGGLTTLILVVSYFRRRRFRRPTGLCMACGYDLTGNASGACPECGRAMV